MSLVEKSTRKSFFPPNNKNDLGNNKIKKPDNIQKSQYDKKNNLDNLTKNDVKINISDKIKDFAFIKKAVDNAPEKDNTSKIADIKDQIKRGVYKVDYDALANKILNEEFI